MTETKSKFNLDAFNTITHDFYHRDRLNNSLEPCLQNGMTYYPVVTLYTHKQL